MMMLRPHESQAVFAVLSGENHFKRGCAVSHNPAAPSPLFRWMALLILFATGAPLFARRTLVVPPFRNKIRAGGSNATATSQIMVTGPLNEPLTLLSPRIRVEFQNISNTAQTVSVWVRAGTNWDTFQMISALTPAPILTSDTSPVTLSLSALGGGFDSGHVLFDFMCNITGPTTGTCTFSITGGMTCTGTICPSMSSTFTPMTFTMGVPPGGDLQRDLQVSQDLGLTISVNEDQGAITGFLEPMVIRNGGYVELLNGASEVSLNGGRPF